MKYYFPAVGQNYTYLQTNRSDDLGSIWSSMGLDFQSNLGTMRVAPRLKIGASTADDAQLGLPIAFEFADVRLWAICGGSVFKNGTTPNAAWTEDASAGAVTDYTTNSDLETFDNELWSTTNTNLYSKVLDGAGTGAWTSRDTFSDPGPHALKYFAKFNRLYYRKELNTIASIDTSYTVAGSGNPYFLDLGIGNTITALDVTTTQVWAGVSASSSGSGLTGSVFAWDGISAQATAKYLLKSRRVVAITVLDDIPYVMDGDGVLSKFTGSSFKEVGRLPFDPVLPLSSFVARNGMMATNNDTILVVVNNVNGDSTSSFYENIPSGVWEWSEEFGFTHKYSFTYTTASTITDFGQNRISAAGAIYGVDAVAQSTADRNGTILVGATYFTDATTTTNAIFYDDSNNTLQKKGYFVTTWFNSEEIEDKFSRLWATFRRLLASTDSLVFKYRIQEEEPTYATITWVNTTSFTTTTDITAYGPTATGFNGTQGGEVEVIQGTGSASCVHIINIVNNAGTYTVTVDSAVTGVTTGTAKARFQKWIKLNPTVEPAQIRSYLQAGIGANNIRIQIKGCLTFTGDGEFFKLALFSNEDIKITL